MGHKWTRPADGRHTYASLALASGKSIRWVAAQLGHSNPELTLRVYGYAMPEEDVDLSFLDFGGTKRHPRGTKRIGASAMKKPHRVTPRRGFGIMERETGSAGQRSWPCACDCVAANRRPSAWETEPRVRSNAYLQLLRCMRLQGAAQSGTGDVARRHTAPNVSASKETKWTM